MNDSTRVWNSRARELNHALEQLVFRFELPT